MSQYLSGTDPTKIVNAKSDVNPKFPQIDTTTTATLAFPTPAGSAETGTAEGLTASLNANFLLPPRLGLFPRWPNMTVRVTGTRGTAVLSDYILPWFYHYIKVESAEQEGELLRKRTEKRYGNVGWTT